MRWNRVLLGASVLVVSAGLVGALPLPSHEQQPDGGVLGAGSHQQSSGKVEPFRHPRKGVWSPRQQQRQRQWHEPSGLRDFPQQQHFWRGGPFIYLGSGIRYHKLGWFDIQVYEGALYVEQQTAAAELRRLQADGFFGQGDYSTDRLCAALAAANTTRVMQLRLLRSITGRQFTDALSKSLAPRVAGTDAEQLVPQFMAFLEDKGFTTGECIPLMWSGAGLETDVLPPGGEAFADVKPAEVVDSQTFAAALYDIYLSADGPLRGARDKWAAAARALLANDDAASNAEAIN